MNIVYAFRRETWYPHHGQGTNLMPEGVRKTYLKKVREIGFDGLEMGPALPGGEEVTEAAVRDLRKELEDAGLPCMGIRGGGGMAHPRVSAASRNRLEGAIRFASWIGAGIVNTTTGTPPRDPDGPGIFVGEPTSQGSSRESREEDFERTARGFTDAADLAADLDVKIAIEVHQHSITDNSWSTLHLLDLIDRPNVGVNLDLGNIYWTYDIPEETCEEAIAVLAPRTTYWHCKNLIRVHIPENRHAIFLQVPLPDGEIDYRFALCAMHEAGFDGAIAIEGLRLGDQLYGDQKSVAYIRALLAEIRQTGTG